ncbi:hypothetical protein DUQ00_00035 [Salmonella bongori]|nr:hypothetical protein [Salmonella bongori]ECC9594757.1 hypothetical protein [Salmonella bongori]ECG1192367.1 hypothetical protein [Salmonella bongori]
MIQTGRLYAHAELQPRAYTSRSEICFITLAHLIKSNTNGIITGVTKLLAYIYAEMSALDPKIISGKKPIKLLSNS